MPALGEARHRYPCSPCRESLYSHSTTPSEEKRVGHSEGIMRTRLLVLGGTLLVGALALAPGPVPLPAAQSAGSAAGGALC